MKIKNILGVIALLSLTSSGYAAKPGAYIGGGLGYSILDDFSDATKQTGGGVGGALFAGYNFNTFIGLELAYRAYADTTYQYGGSYWWGDFDYSFYAITLMAKGYVPFENSPFALFASLGGAQVHGSSDFNGVDSSSALVAAVGLGASYNINPHVTTSLEYTRTGSKDASGNNIGIPGANLVTWNLIYNFS